MRRTAVWLAAFAALWATGCDRLPGKPDAADRYQRPTEIMDFDILYGQNCAACHGAEGRLGPSRPLADPVYLAYVGPERMREIVARGVPGTPMPGFTPAENGTLADDQITALVREIYARWADPASLAGVTLPAYGSGGASTAGGHAAFGQFCADCHGVDGDGGAKAGSVVDPNYLALVSDQNLRTSIVAGRTDLGMPDWRTAGDRPMTPQEISDVVAWLTAHRKTFPDAR